MKRNSFAGITRRFGQFVILTVLYGGSFLTANAQSLHGTWERISDKGTGHAIAQAGDINGDGYGDILVANPYYTNGNVHEGRIELYYGLVTGFTATPVWTAESNRDSAYLGWSVAGMCDINYDGYTDVVAGAPGADNVQGRVYVYYGSSSGLSSSAVMLNESQAGERFGYAVSTADVNNDGYSEIFIGAPYNVTGTSSGKVHAYFGSSSGLPSSATWSISGDGHLTGFGSSIAIGFVTTSGTNRKANLIIGAPGTDPGVIAYVTVTDALPITPVEPPTKKFVLTDNRPGSKFGHSVAIAGDINQDGYEDIIIGAPNYSNGQDNEGNATIYQGGSSAMAVLWSVESNESGAKFGTNVAGKGQINNDSYDDIAVTSPGSANSCLSVYPGTSTGIAASKYALVDLSEEFSTVIFTKITATGKGGILAGAPSITRGTAIGKGEVKFIREFDDIIKREGFVREESRNIGDLATTLSAYPNPAAHLLTLDITSVVAPQISRIEILNALGVVVHSIGQTNAVQNGTSQSVTLELPSLPSGMYYAAVQMNGQTVFQPVQINQ